MKTTDNPVSESMEMIWSAREKVYEETKDMTDEEFLVYQQEARQWARQETDKLRPEDFDFPFLRNNIK